MAKRYYTLAVRTNGRWRAEFGDYDRETVVAERDDYRDHDVKAKDLRIIVTGDTMNDVMAGIDKLNA